MSFLNLSGKDGPDPMLYFTPHSRSQRVISVLSPHCFFYSKMPVVVSPEFTSTILNGDDVLYDLVMQVHFSQAKARLEWQTQPDVFVEYDNCSVFSEVVMLNRVGRPTSMPCWIAYDKVWTRAGYQNPFTVNWLDYDRQSRLTKRYIELVLETLAEQCVIWGSDDDTRYCLAYEYFNEYFESLQRLSDYKGDGLRRIDSFRDMIRVLFTS